MLRQLRLRFHLPFPQALSNLAWALASLGCQRPELLDRVAKEGARRCATMQPQHLSNVLWALATLGYQVRPR